MSEPELIAERIIYAIDKDSRGFEIRLMLGKPYQTDSKFGDWACPVAMIGLHGRFPDMYGVDSWQALSLAVLTIKRLLTYFIEDGGKLYCEENGEEITIDEIFNDGPPERPEPNGSLTDEQQSRVDQLTMQELQQIDDSLLNSAGFEWRKVAFVVGEAMLATKDSIQSIPDIFYAKRIQKLVDEGRLESQGNLEYMRFSEVKLPK